MTRIDNLDALGSFIGDKFGRLTIPSDGDGFVIYKEMEGTTKTLSVGYFDGCPAIDIKTCNKTIYHTSITASEFHSMLIAVCDLVAIGSDMCEDVLDGVAYFVKVVHNSIESRSMLVNPQLQVEPDIVAAARQVEIILSGQWSNKTPK